MHRKALAAPVIALVLATAGCSGKAPQTTTPSGPTASAPAPGVSATPSAASPGTQRIVMPDLTGQTGAEAEAKLKSLGFSTVSFAGPGAATPQTSKVIKQSARAGDHVRASAHIILTLTKS